MRLFSGLLTTLPRCTSVSSPYVSTGRYYHVDSTDSEDSKADYNQASNAALSWLLDHDFLAEKPVLAKLGPNKGAVVGMQRADGSCGFRVEHHAPHGAHLNVFSKGLKKGDRPPHFPFEATPETVTKICRQFKK